MSNSSPILVTGAAGFIGARFVESVRADGLDVISVDRRSHFSDRAEHAEVDFGTIIERDELFDWLAQEQPTVSAVVHMGACTDTTNFDREYFDRVNVRYSQQLWDWCCAQGVPFVYASSASTYGDGTKGYVDDESQLGTLQPLNPYGESKHSFDLWALEREQAGSSPPSWSGFKFFNVYGFGERHKTKMASVILQAWDQIRERGQVRLFESHHPDYPDGGQTRDFVSVEDVVAVLRFALEKPLARGVFNLGTGNARTFGDLVRAVFAEMGVPEKIEFIPTPVELRDKYQYFTEADMSRLRREGYERPFLSLEEGTRRYLARLGAFEAARST